MLQSCWLLKKLYGTRLYLEQPHGEDINKQLTLLLFKKKKREDRSGSQKKTTKPNQMTKITTFLAIDLTSSVDDTNNFTKKNENHIHKINETNIIRHSRYFEVNQYCHFQDNSRRSNTLVTLSMAQIWRRLNFKKKNFSF